MSARYTAGPLTPVVDPKTGDVGLLDDHRNVVAECFAAIRSRDERADEEALANARLFAASHQLLTASVDAAGALGACAEIMQRLGHPKAAEIAGRYAVALVEAIAEAAGSAS